MKLYIILTFFAFGASAKCNIHPKYWCQNASIRKECDVLNSCREFYSNADPVSIELYYESLCPFCRQFITEQLYPTWNKLLDTEIMEVTLVAYGNAVEKEVSPGQYEYICQHGKDECTLNSIENCVMAHSSNDIEKFFPIINCIEKSEQGVKDARGCVESGGLNWSDVETCANGTQGMQLVHQAAVTTSQLNPAHKYVPWITVNNVHDDQMQNDAQTDLLKFVCQQYNGEKPAECSDSLYHDMMYSVKVDL